LDDEWLSILLLSIEKLNIIILKIMSDGHKVNWQKTNSQLHNQHLRG